MSKYELDRNVVLGFHRKFVTGVLAITTIEDSHPRGLVVNAFSSLSLDPPTIIVCVQQKSTSHALLYARDHFAVNMLAVDQIDHAKTLAAKGTDKFANIPWSAGPFGSPIIQGSVGWLEVVVTERFQATTHTLFVARVVAAEYTERPPLVYSGGKFYDGERLSELA